MAKTTAQCISHTFLRTKDSALSGLDYSRKGSFDEPIIELIQNLNGIPQYFTTSSCSGRTIIAGYHPEAKFKKKGCKWLYVTHGMADPAEIFTALRQDALVGDYSLKFEPFILHVQCANVEAAKALMQTAVACGYRNSGISIGNKGKVITAVRSTSNLEVPLVSEGQLLVTDKYIHYLVGQANRKMEENFARIKLFKGVLQFPPMAVEGVSHKSNEMTIQTKQLDLTQRANQHEDSCVKSADYDVPEGMFDTIFTM